MRTQSQEYLRPFHQENKSLQPQGAQNQGRRHAQQGRGGALSYGGSMMNKNGGMLSIYKTQAGQDPAQLFEDLQR